MQGCNHHKSACLSIMEEVGAFYIDSLLSFDRLQNEQNTDFPAFTWYNTDY